MCWMHLNNVAATATHNIRRPKTLVNEVNFVIYFDKTLFLKKLREHENMKLTEDHYVNTIK